LRDLCKFKKVMDVKTVSSCIGPKIGKISWLELQAGPVLPLGQLGNGLRPPSGRRAQNFGKKWIAYI